MLGVMGRERALGGICGKEGGHVLVVSRKIKEVSAERASGNVAHLP